MISVVIPLYNKARHVESALKSVMSQTFKPFEIIVVDDGSTDNGSVVVKQFVGASVRLIAQENLGVSAARNRGLEEATTKYVAFLDADDYWLPNHLEVLHDLIRKWPDASLVSTSYYIQRDGQMYSANSALPIEWEGVVEDFFKTYAKGLSLVNSSTACVNRYELIEKGGFPVGVKRGEDVVAWIRLALEGEVVHKVAHTAVYNQEADNRSYLLREQEPPGSLLYMTELLKSRRLEAEIMDSISLLFGRIALMTAADFYLNGDVAGARAITELLRETGRLKTAIAIRLIMLLPVGMLRLVKTLRHRRV